jgi:hypothetical protein
MVGVASRSSEGSRRETILHQIVLRQGEYSVRAMLDADGIDEAEAVRIAELLYGRVGEL